MSTYIAVSKEPIWIKRLGFLLLFPSGIGLIPFKSDTIQMFDPYFFAISSLGILLLLRANQRIGWRIVLEENVIYYSKYNLYSSWKKRRSQEFALSVEKIEGMEILKSQIVITYDSSRHLTFNSRGLGSYERIRVEKLKKFIE
jgi:hypothetical protein